MTGSSLTMAGMLLVGDCGGTGRGRRGPWPSPARPPAFSSTCHDEIPSALSLRSIAMPSFPHSTAAARRVPVLQLVLSIVAAGAASAVVVWGFSPFSAATAVFSPPLYAVIAGAYSFFPFLVRRALGFRWSATSVG